MKTILYLGDGPVGSAANYLLGILKYSGYQVSHFFNGKLPPSTLKKKFSTIIISDYPRKNISETVMREIEKHVSRGTGLLMIGGWSSFAGLDGNYYGSVIAKMLPVFCLSKDDRRNLASGAIFRQTNPHPILKEIPLKPSPVIIGYNRVILKKTGKMILELKESTSGKKSPLLVVGSYGIGKTAAFATDVAPHWCGGLVDWGAKRVKIQVAKGIQIEVGDLYVKFLTNLLNWLATEN